MTSKEVKEKLNGYTKDQIINAISKISYRNYYTSFICDIIRIIDEEIYINENNSIDKAEKEWEKASKEYINYSKELQLKYSESVATSDLIAEDFSKYIELYKKERETWKKLEKLQDEQENRLNKKIERKNKK